MPWVRENRLGLALACVVLVAALAASSRVTGLAWDDGVYVAAGHALAAGRGYVLADRIGNQAVPLYPAGYPLIVALVWRLVGSQGATLAGLALLSALSVAAAAFLWWRVLREAVTARTAALLVAVPALSYATLLTGELRMADAPYALLVAAAAALWRRALESRRAMAALIVTATLAVPLRTAGAVLPIAVALLLVARRRWWPAAGAVAAAAGLYLALGLTLRPPEPSYLEVVRVAWAAGGSGLETLRATLGGDLWTSIVAMVAPPLVYSSAIQRAAHGALALHAAYVLAVAAIVFAAAWGGWRRLAVDRWAVGDLVLVGAVALIFVVPVGMLPRFLVPVGPVLALWLWERTGARGGRWATAAGAVLAVLLALTMVEAVRHVRSQPRILAARGAAYAAAGHAARAWLGARGLVAAEFPEALWLETGLRSVSTNAALEIMETPRAALAEAAGELGPVTRGCLLDTGHFPVWGRLFFDFEGRPGAQVLPGLDGRYVRVVCWPGGAAPAP